MQCMKRTTLQFGTVSFRMHDIPQGAVIGSAAHVRLLSREHDKIGWFVGASNTADGQLKRKGRQVTGLEYCSQIPPWPQNTRAIF